MKLSCMAVRSLLILLLVNPVAAGFEFDTTTRGNWQTRYGADGYYVHQGPQKHAGAFEVNGAPWIWTAATADESAVASLDGQSRIASCWYSSATFVVTAGIEDGVERQVAFYFLDWDANGRVQKIERLDPVTGAVLDETTLRDFQFGTYLTVNATGLVRLRITPLAGANAVLSGVFLGAPLPPLQQVATLLISPQGGQYSAPVNVLLSTETDGAEIYYTTDGRDPAVVGIRYLGPFTMTRAGYVRVIGRMEGFADSDEAGALFTFEGPATAVDFLGFDWQTMGSWIGNVGNAGYFLTMFAPVASGTAIDHNATPRWVWLWSTDDPATLQKPPAANSADRYAACWYDLDVLSFRLDLREARALILSVYALDYDSGGRIQQFDLLNPATGELIDSQSVERFHDGVYLKWRISSSVVLRVSRLAGPNAVVSGIFLDPSDGNFVALPQFTPPGGTYNEVVDVSIASATDGAQIRYTTDGSVPTESAILYTEPFRISQSITLTARAFKDGMAPSGLKTAAFTILGSPAATLQFTPPGGTYSGVVDVSIASA
ncbi:MAG: chitobiase/beta-hexosaminidase C-terminal domain-containing protein, partial [Limisphaerales bacterium]